MSQRFRQMLGKEDTRSVHASLLQFAINRHPVNRVAKKSTTIEMPSTAGAYVGGFVKFDFTPVGAVPAGRVQRSRIPSGRLIASEDCCFTARRLCLVGCDEENRTDDLNSLKSLIVRLNEIERQILLGPWGVIRCWLQPREKASDRSNRQVVTRWKMPCSCGVAILL